MAELQTLARPYAKAVFELARESGDYEAWSAQLAAIAQAMADPEVAALVEHPALSRAQRASILTGALGRYLTGQGVALLRLLVDNDRLSAAGEIAAQFEALRAEAQRRVDVEITTAVPVQAHQQQALSSAIAKRLGREVVIDWKTDESLLAGAIVRAGDLVIDGSVSGELDRLRGALAAA